MSGTGATRLACGPVSAALACAFLVCAGSEARAQDEANLVRNAAPSIARLDLSGFAVRTQCTAVQFGRRAALAISFCLQGGRFDRAHLLFGYGRGEWLEERGIRSAFNDPAQALLKLLCLDGGLPRSRFARPERPLVKGEPVWIAGYAAPKTEVLDLRGCNVQRVVRANEFNVDCDTGPGSAGSAVFRGDASGATLLGLLASPSPTGSLVLGWNGGHPDDLCPYSPN